MLSSTYSIPLGFTYLKGVGTYNFGYDLSSKLTACSALPNGYYVSSYNLDPGTILYNDLSLSTIAIDGIYSDSVTYYDVTGGSGQITGNGSC